MNESSEHPYTLPWDLYVLYYRQRDNGLIIILCTVVGVILWCIVCDFRGDEKYTTIKFARTYIIRIHETCRGEPKAVFRILASHLAH